MFHCWRACMIVYSDFSFVLIFPVIASLLFWKIVFHKLQQLGSITLFTCHLTLITACFASWHCDKIFISCISWQLKRPLRNSSLCALEDDRLLFRLHEECYQWQKPCSNIEINLKKWESRDHVGWRWHISGRAFMQMFTFPFTAMC